LIIGYARVSTDGQTLDAQVAALTAAGATKISKEKISGAASDRRALAQALAAAGLDDTLLVTRLDRLARSTLQLLIVLDRLSQSGVLFRSLGDTWADTTTPHGRLMLAVLGGLAEFERDLIKSRTAEGRRRAIARGVKMGPKFKLTADQRRFVAEERAKGESVRHLARVLGVSKDTVARVPASLNINS
jgi:DNA invertase Pin-like site-specific DNA recombinase